MDDGGKGHVRLFASSTRKAAVSWAVRPSISTADWLMFGALGFAVPLAAERT